MTKEEIQFIEDNIINFETTKLGYIRNLNPNILSQYESIYKKYIDDNYILTAWCSSCVYEMFTRLVYYYESNVKK